MSWIWPPISIERKRSSHLLDGGLDLVHPHEGVPVGPSAAVVGGRRRLVLFGLVHRAPSGASRSDRRVSMAAGSGGPSRVPRGCACSQSHGGAERSPLPSRDVSRRSVRGGGPDDGAVSALRHHDGGRRSHGGAAAVRCLPGQGVDPTRARAGALGPQLHVEVVDDHDVVRRVTVAQSVVGLVRGRRDAARRRRRRPDASGVATTVRYLWFGGRNTFGVTTDRERRRLARGRRCTRVVVRRPERVRRVERVDLVRRLELDVVVERDRLVGVDVPFGRRRSPARPSDGVASAWSR